MTESRTIIYTAGRMFGNSIRCLTMLTVRQKVSPGGADENYIGWLDFRYGIPNMNEVLQQKWPAQVLGMRSALSHFNKEASKL